MINPFKKIFLFLFALAPFSLAWSISLDWSGSGRIEGYYQQKAHQYGDFYFSLNSKINIQDGLSFNTRFDLIGFENQIEDLWDSSQFLTGSSLFHQRGFVFLYTNSPQSQKTLIPFVLPTQFYLDYEREFVKFRAGRAPYHFGLGSTYMATKNPLALWLNTPNQISIYMKYNNFYFQPSLFHQYSSSKNSLSAVAQLGYSQKDLAVSILYEYKLDATAFTEVYGEYQQGNWNVKLSSTYAFTKQLSLAGALESSYKVLYKIPIDLELKAGALKGAVSFNPQYNVALLKWNRLMPINTTSTNQETSTEKPQSNTKDFTYQIAPAQIKEALYISPRVTFSFLDENLQIQPSLLVAKEWEDSNLNYELDLSGKYKINETLYLNLVAGALYQTQWNLALLAQAAVSF